MANIKLIMCIVFKSPLLQDRAPRTFNLLVTILFIFKRCDNYTSVSIKFVPRPTRTHATCISITFIKLLGNLLSDPTCCVVL